MTPNEQRKRERNKSTIENMGAPTYYGGRRGLRLAEDMRIRTVKLVELEDGNRHSKRSARARKRPYVRFLAKMLGRGLVAGFVALKDLAES